MEFADVVVVELEPVIIARYVRIHPLVENMASPPATNVVGFNFELQGCPYGQ